MTDIERDIRSERAFDRAERKSLTPPDVMDPCGTCNDTGVVPGTETEHLFGDPCPEGCRLNLGRILDRR